MTDDDDAATRGEEMVNRKLYEQGMRWLGAPVPNPKPNPERTTTMTTTTTTHPIVRILKHYQSALDAVDGINVAFQVIGYEHHEIEERVALDDRAEEGLALKAAYAVICEAAQMTEDPKMSMAVGFAMAGPSSRPVLEAVKRIADEGQGRLLHDALGTNQALDAQQFAFTLGLRDMMYPEPEEDDSPPF